MLNVLNVALNNADFMMTNNSHMVVQNQKTENDVKTMTMISSQDTIKITQSPVSNKLQWVSKNGQNDMSVLANSNQRDKLKDQINGLNNSLQNMSQTMLNYRLIGVTSV